MTIVSVMDERNTYIECATRDRRGTVCSGGTTLAGSTQCSLEECRTHRRGVVHHGGHIEAELDLLEEMLVVGVEGMVVLEEVQLSAGCCVACCVRCARCVHMRLLCTQHNLHLRPLPCYKRRRLFHHQVFTHCARLTHAQRGISFSSTF